MGDRVKSLLTRIGASCSRGLIHKFNAGINYLEVGRWLGEFGADTSQRFDDRFALYDHLAQRIGDVPVLFLEFGVFEGESLRYWAGKLKHPESRLHGFDSFHGLPADFNLTTRRGAFDAGGVPPEIDDARVRFFQGWFEETLPGYTVEPGRVLVIHLDADLYSSTAFVLRSLQDSIVPGTFLLFDEFADRQHELYAFDEFLQRSGYEFEFVGGDRSLARAAFRRTA